MSAAKHTDGPWHVEAQPDGSWEICIATRGAWLMHLRSAKATTEAERAEDEANVALMAAAPVMLKALQDALIAWDRLYPTTTYAPGQGDRWEDVEFREMSAVRDAIRAAAGVAP